MKSDTRLADKQEIVLEGLGTPTQSSFMTRTFERTAKRMELHRNITVFMFRLVHTHIAADLGGGSFSCRRRYSSAQPQMIRRVLTAMKKQLQSKKKSV